MKLIKKLAAAASALAMAASMAAYVPMAALTANAVDDCNDDWLHAVGSKLYDKDGNQVWLTGANWFGLNCTENFPHGLWSADIDKLLSGVADRGINVIRFPISTELIISWMNGTPYKCEGLNPKNEESYKFNPDFCHADGSEMNSMEVFDVIMQKCKKYGIKAFVDIHSPASHNSGHNYELWYYEPSSKTADDMATIKEAAGDQGAPVTWEQWIDATTWLARKYANDDTLIAYDLKNEPHGKRGYTGDKCPSDIAKWDDSTDHNNWKYSAEECAKSVLAVNPNALILIEGIEQYPKEGYTFDTPDVWEPKTEADKKWYGAWWGGNLRGVKNHPVDLGSAKLNAQIVYSPHDYGPSVYNQTWFDKEFTTDTLLDDYWRDTWAYINEDDIAPLLIGEWGGHMDAGKNQHWMELLRDYMIDNHINHTFWCLNPNSGDTGGLLDATFSSWDDKKYALMEESLWQTSSSGKYIGLDHQHPLGLNGTGLSLTEYYSEYDKSEGSNLNGGKGASKSDPVTIETMPTEAKPTETDKPTEAKPTETDKPTEAKPTETDKPTGNNNPTDADKIVESNSADVKYGDVNLDGTVDIMDVIAINKYLTGSKQLDAGAQANADVNRDNKVDSSDSLTILKHAVGIIEKLPV
ncbi:MAG: cellulase family glycosylhydrolase [Oscillospiraceae bacterium]|nr:cellulase family glycosylhydrolase [Oscillospiraceae bacterium]